MKEDLLVLHEKMDRLAVQLEILTDQAEAQGRRSQELDELKNDLIPIGNQLISLTIQELEDIGSEFALEDLLYLLKRVLRNTQLILTMMDRFEALMGIADEVDLLGKQVFNAAVEALDRLEREGVIGQAQSLVQNLTRASTLAELNQLLVAFQQESGDEPAPSLMNLARELRRPETRRGMKRALLLLQSLGSLPQDDNQ